MKKIQITLTLALSVFAILGSKAQLVKLTDANPQNSRSKIVHNDIGLVDENTFKDANTEGLTGTVDRNDIYLLDEKPINHKTFINLKVDKIAKMEVINDKSVIEKNFPQYKKYHSIIKITSKK